MRRIRTAGAIAALAVLGVTATVVAGGEAAASTGGQSVVVRADANGNCPQGMTWQGGQCVA
jgi:hypothetical protein